MKFPTRPYRLQNTFLSILLIIFFILISGSIAFSQCGNKNSLIKGPKGGCFYYSKSGNKVYVDRSCCSSLGLINGESIKSSISRNPDCGVYKSRPLVKGTRGGCYYINRNGNKTYVNKQLCKC